jgi:hypothetical protein
MNRIGLDRVRYPALPGLGSRLRLRSAKRLESDGIWNIHDNISKAGAKIP